MALGTVLPELFAWFVSCPYALTGLRMTSDLSEVVQTCNYPVFSRLDEASGRRVQSFEQAATNAQYKAVFAGARAAPWLYYFNKQSPLFGKNAVVAFPGATYQLEKLLVPGKTEAITDSVKYIQKLRCTGTRGLCDSDWPNWDTLQIDAL